MVLPVRLQTAFTIDCRRRAAPRLASPVRMCWTRTRSAPSRVTSVFAPTISARILIQWSDVIVGDYNHYFDLSAVLHGLTVANQWTVGVLVDEAHNLIGRARKMYTAELDQAHFQSARRSAPVQHGKVLARLNRCWNALSKESAEAYRVYSAVPDSFLAALQQAINAMTEYLTENPDGINGELQRFYFDSLRFTRIAKPLIEHSLFDVTADCREQKARDGLKRPDSRTQKRPCGALPQKHHSRALIAPSVSPPPNPTLLFSATLKPMAFLQRYGWGCL